jgi:hypothetical protein
MEKIGYRNCYFYICAPILHQTESKLFIAVLKKRFAMYEIISVPKTELPT